MSRHQCHPPDVSGRSSLQLNIRYSKLLISQASTPIAAEEYTNADAAVSTADGQLDTLILPQINGLRMQIFLDEVAQRSE